MKKFIALFVCVILLVSIFTACSDGETSPTDPQTGGKTWSMYWYLCGSDLESDGGAATSDLNELTSIELPEGVNIVIQTGGANTWHHETVDANYMERYVYNSEGLQLIEQLDVDNMGETSVFVDFMKFAQENYPADNTMLNFWNHGGGSLTGAAFDELHNNDSLTLDELYAGLNELYGEGNTEDYPLDIVGFDTCLMATLETANVFSPYANYLVASQELEPGNGWEYSGIMQAFVDDPSISPLDLGKTICDTFYAGCEAVGTESDVTLSVTNLSKIPALLQEYEEYGVQALNYALTDTSFFTRFNSFANETENYGGNTRDQGYTNMIDMGGLVGKTEDILGEQTQKVISAIDDAVEYKVVSNLRPDGMGLSTYYPYDGDINNLYTYSNISAVQSFSYLYNYALTGDLTQDGIEFLQGYSGNVVGEVPQPNSFENSEVTYEDAIVTFDENGSGSINLGPEAYDTISTIAFELYYDSGEGSDFILLGSDNDIIADWDNGIFTENFRGVWGNIDGAICYMDIVYEGDDYNEYVVPVYINDVEYNLYVMYDFNTEMYYILGARQPIDEEGAADKNIYELQVGDVVDIIHYYYDIESGSEEVTPYISNTIQVTEETMFYETILPDGYFHLMFRMEDSMGNYTYSQVASYESLNGEWFVFL